MEREISQHSDVDPPEHMSIGEVCQHSNTGYDQESAFMLEAAAGAAQRRRAGYGADGTPGGAYDESNPPPGKVCRGFLKGNVGIVWGDAPDPGCSLSDDGYCDRCGLSLYYYAGKACPRGGNAHPVWTGPPPPSFCEENG